MLTVDGLKALGANTDEGLQRCMNNEMFYLRMVKMALSDDRGVKALEAAIGSGDVKAAFEAAHGLKGVLANLALTSCLEPVSELTELLRSGKPGDYEGYLRQFLAVRERYTALLKED